MEATAMSRHRWNYRVIEHNPSDGGPPSRAIHEVYYVDGKPVAYGETPATVTWDADEGPDALENILCMMRRAAERDVLTADDFDKEVASDPAPSA
jgi:hypothetical protein